MLKFCFYDCLFQFYCENSNDRNRNSISKNADFENLKMSLIFFNRKTVSL